MVPAPETASRDFMKIVDELWQKNIDIYATSPNQFFSDVNEIFADSKLFVSLHTSKVLPGYLVSARCMVQNTLGPEYFPLSCTIINGSKAKEATYCFRDAFDGDVSIVTKERDSGMRYCYKMVMVPGATEWWLDDFIQAHSTPFCVANDEQMEECSAPVPVEVLDFVAKIFDNGSPELKPNTVVDVYGYLSKPGFLDLEGHRSEDLNVHVLRISEVNHVTPELALSSNSIHQSSIRSDLVKDVASVLGSTTNADIFVNFLVSTTFSRPAGSPPLCSMVLNIVGVEDSQSVNSITELVRHLMPKVKLLTITPDLLSNKRFAPFKDYESEELLQGELQLSNGTVLVIDETELPSGRFTATGFAEENLKVLDDLAVGQNMEYDYSFYKIPMDVDYNILILSRKESRLFEKPFRIPLQKSGTPLSLSDVQEKRNFLQKSRSCVRLLSLAENVSEKIQDSFVSMCSSLNGTAEKAAFLNEMLTMSRLIASSSGSPCVEFEHWEQALRISSANSSAMDSWRSRQSFPEI